MIRGIAFFVVIFYVFSCKKNIIPKNSFNEQRTIDSLAIESYLLSNMITNRLNDCYTVSTLLGQPCNGYVTYKVHEKGNGIEPKYTSEILISYKGKLLDTGKEFDSGDGIKMVLSSLISGCQVVIRDMNEGDSVTMYIPSGYAYGESGSPPNIPANSNIIFDMKLHKVIN